MFLVPRFFSPCQFNVLPLYCFRSYIVFSYFLSGSLKFVMCHKLGFSRKCWDGIRYATGCGESSTVKEKGKKQNWASRSFWIVKQIGQSPYQSNMADIARLLYLISYHFAPSLARGCSESSMTLAWQLRWILRGLGWRLSGILAAGQQVFSRRKC